MGKTEARDLSDALFARLAGLERESAAYSYVRGTIIELNMPLVRFVASRFRNRSADRDDILQVGTIGLIKAVDGYDHRRGVEFATYAIPTITGEIKRFYRDASWPLRVPRSLQELYLRVARTSERMEQDLGRLPTAQELAEKLGLDVDDAASALAVGRAYRAGSLDALREDREDETGSALLDRLGERDARLDLVECRESVRPLLKDLTPRERTILMLRFWGDCTQSEIAEQIGCSQMQVSRLLTATLGGIRARLTSPAADAR
ncbi:SigB/SigF/SigG family RNA polymerase sigma factor [Kitasatospora sp. RG8]|uniref:SigB/SigF/SigG family RNA polymerase sigma factor n=1 Tax=Kitasatospora sp. RG8 TaxID=2820815 RepID=UPI001FD814E6|nr:SigB/SigF/SigG family RNA polymerase sigma factor [Kitasatospora sp. RG8]